MPCTVLAIEENIKMLKSYQEHVRATEKDRNILYAVSVSRESKWR